MTPVYIASTTAATSASIAAAHRSSEAQDAACTAMMDSFTSHGATLKARHTYAECVKRLDPPAPSDTANDKSAVAALLAAVVIGAVIGAVTLDHDFGPLGGGFLGAVLGFLGAFVLALIVTAVAFVAS
jgi:hypothetical protein